MCRVIDMRQAVLAKNDALAGAVREELTARGTTVVNLLSSPGSGKTALLERVLLGMRARTVPVAALTADLATENDARRLARAGVPVKQVLTGGLCHLEAAQLRSHLEGWLPADSRVLFVENVGNLVCPAAYDLGETLRVTLMSVTEGEDKPLKYPTAFGLAHLVVLTKTDIAAAVGFDEAAFAANVTRVNPGVPVLATSARDGEGVDAFTDHVLAVAAGTEVHRPRMATGRLGPGKHAGDHQEGYGHGLGPRAHRAHPPGPGPRHAAPGHEPGGPPTVTAR
ncbi:hydrogenase accessory protein HypB [Streptomyces cinnamoneus]|uniref:Hydrogenase accessory protein HypB n=1 Tax=Streptomyces cinnamoneus TaxID=53446 RepID=A0A2G1XNY3_STRCJ|nr:hydrogenase nickel incorporation protein HypB [Streptomyces cinnamoneus]PHQ52923.1 hydrogenase accessory protein HypB [Streptomyces cinnamoneus]PPT11416.1 hydrogenase accessory protein HypB [Streptomyces cinnamoneus]